MQSFFFPCLRLFPEFDGDTVDAENFTLHKRLWQTSTFDLATLASRHRLHMSWHLVEAFLTAAHCEIEVGADSYSDAQAQIGVLQAMLYASEADPFVMPFGTTFSLNQYSGINSRDGGHYDSLPEGLRRGLASEDAVIELWPHEPALKLACDTVGFAVRPDYFKAAASDVPRWVALEDKYKQLGTLRRALCMAPFIPDVSSSLLHFWQGIESLFTPPNEIAFRLALYVAQLAGGIAGPEETYKRIKKSYAARSRAAHGSVERVSEHDWKEARMLAALCVKAILSRGGLPTEDQLLAELLAFER